jgi:hypothetical protein
MAFVIKFDKPIYKIAAVKAAAKDFSEFASFSIENRKDCIVVNITDIKTDSKEDFQGEFGNYVIGLMK